MAIRTQSESVETAAQSSTPQEEVQQRKKYNMPAGFCQYVAEMQRNKSALNKLKVTTMDNGYRYEMQGDQKGSEEETLRLLRHNYNLLPAERKFKLELKYRSQKSSSKRLRMEATEGRLAPVDVEEIGKYAHRSNPSELVFASHTEHKMFMTKLNLYDESYPFCDFFGSEFNEGKKFDGLPKLTLVHLLAYPHAVLYACHFCLHAFTTSDLLNVHECKEFRDWKNAQESLQPPEMVEARVFVCCTDCGKYLRCRSSEIESLQEFVEGHLVNRVVTIVVNFAGHTPNKNPEVMFKTVPSFARQFSSSCSQCGTEPFTSPEEAVAHFSDINRHPDTQQKKCHKCKRPLPFGINKSEHLLKCYQICDERTKNSILLADWLSTTAPLLWDGAVQCEMDGSRMLQNLEKVSQKYADREQSLTIERMQAGERREQEELFRFQTQLGIPEETPRHGVWAQSTAQRTFIRETIAHTDCERSVDLSVYGIGGNVADKDFKTIRLVCGEERAATMLKEHIARFQEDVILNSSFHNKVPAEEWLGKLYLCLGCYYFVHGEIALANHLTTCQPNEDPRDSVKVFTVHMLEIQNMTRQAYHCFQCSFYGCSLLPLRVHLATRHQIGTNVLLEKGESSKFRPTVGMQFDQTLGLVNGKLPCQSPYETSNPTMAFQLETLVLSESLDETMGNLKEKINSTSAARSEEPMQTTPMDTSMIEEINVTTEIQENLPEELEPQEVIPATRSNPDNEQTRIAANNEETLVEKASEAPFPEDDPVISTEPNPNTNDVTTTEKTPEDTTSPREEPAPIQTESNLDIVIAKPKNVTTDDIQSTSLRTESDGTLAKNQTESRQIEDELIIDPTEEVQSVLKRRMSIAVNLTSILQEPIREETNYVGAKDKSSSAKDADDDDIILVDVPQLKETISKQIQVVRAPSDDADCMIEEVDTNAVGRPVNVLSVREKKYQCTRCSEKFFTANGHDDHIAVKHRLDGGSTTTVSVEYGMPLIRSRDFYICVLCSTVYDHLPLFQRHMFSTHASCPPIVCPLCSFVSFNLESAKTHWDFHQANMKVGGIPWLCLEHNLVFGKDSELLFHAQKTHNTTLLFFCKRCFFATLNEITIVRHLRDCCVVKPTTEVWPQTASLQGEAGLGVVAANAVHYQPHDEKQWIMALKSAGRPETAHPSLCIHRTLLAQNHSVILCKDRDCNTWYVQPTYLATFEEETDRVLALQVSNRCVTENSWKVLTKLEEMQKK